MDKLKMHSPDLIACARKFFAEIPSEQVRYDMVDSCAKLMDLVI